MGRNSIFAEMNRELSQDIDSIRKIAKRIVPAAEFRFEKLMAGFNFELQFC